jgi:WD40 repeat protein
MTTPLPEGSPPDSFFDRLTAHDEALAAGRAEAAPAGDTAELKGARECLELLEQLWPRGTSAPGAGAGQPPAAAGEGPARLGRFEVVRELGRGGCGIVFLARDPVLNREVALKVPRPDALLTPDLRQRFLREARAAAGLDHPNVVPVYEAGEDGVICYIASAYCPGLTLREWLKARREPVPVRVAASLVAVLAEAVEYTHGKGVLHRDLKPANILIADCGLRIADSGTIDPADGEAARGQSAIRNPQSAIRITDFGLAKVLRDEAVAATRSGALMGTPRYMAPEQVKKELGEVGPHTDVYALGVILYEMLTGRAPFEGDSEFEVLTRVVADEPPPPSLLRPRVHRDLETVCLKCLAKGPARRYASAAELAGDLRRFLDGEPIRARPAGPVERGLRWCRRHPGRAGLTAAALFALLVVLPGWLWYQANLNEARRNERIAHELAGAAQRAREAAQEAAHTQEYFALLNRARQRIATRPLGWTWDALDDLKRAVAVPTAARDPVALRTAAVRCLEGVDLRPRAVLARDFVANAVAFSPDGRYLAAAEHSVGLLRPACSVLLFDLSRGGVVRKLTFPNAVVFWNKRPVPDGARSVAFSPDGKWLAVGTRGGRVHRWDLDRPGERPSASWPASGHAIEFLLVTPDGGALLTCDKPSRSVKRWDVADVKRQPRAFQAKVWVNGVALSPDGAELACSCDGRTEFLSAETLKPLRPPLPHSLAELCYSPDGRFLAGWSAPRLLLFEAATGRPARRLPDSELDAAHEYAPDRLAFSPDGSLLISACAAEVDRDVKVWGMAGGRLLTTLPVGSRGPLTAAPSPDGRTLAVAGDRRVVLYEFAPPAQALLAPHAHPLEGMAFSADGEWLACLVRARDAAGAAERAVTVWKAGGRQRVRRIPLPGGLEGPPALALHPSGAALACTTGRGQVDIWGPAGADGPRTLAAKEPTALRFARGGDRLWAITDGQLRVRSWGWPGGEPASHWDNPFSPLGPGLDQLYCLAAGERWALAGGRDGVTRLLRAGDGRQEKSLPPLGSPVRAATLSPDEALAVLGSQQGEVGVVRLPGGERAATLTAHQDDVTATAFSRDGRLLATASLDGRVHLYLCRDGSFRHLLTLRSPGGVVALDLSADGKRLAFLARHETVVRVWDLGRLHRRLGELGMGDPDWAAAGGQ